METPRPPKHELMIDVVGPLTSLAVGGAALALRTVTPDGLLLEVGMWIADPDKSKGEVISEANLKIWSLLQEEGVTLPHATRELRLVDPRIDGLLDKAATLSSK